MEETPGDTPACRVEFYADVLRVVTSPETVIRLEPLQLPEYPIRRSINPESPSGCFLRNRHLQVLFVVEYNKTMSGKMS